MSKYVPGSRWLLKDRLVEVDGPLSLNQVQVRDIETGLLQSAAHAELTLEPTEKTKGQLTNIMKAEWDRALAMARAFAPHAASASLPQDVTREVAERFGFSERQVRRYRKRYQVVPLVTTLVRACGGRPRGAHLLEPRVEALILHVINKHYACRERASKQEICERVRLLCIRLKWAPPNAKTIKARIQEQEGYPLARKQLGPKSARQRFEPRPGKLVVETALALVQIDHTLADLELIDASDPSRVIGRPWLTLAIDVATRVVLGYYLSMDAPSAVSVAMCIAHAMQPKPEDRLSPGRWPMYGKPACILVDNGKDFRSQALQRGCEQHGIELRWRPVRTPHYGAHIERLMGTFMRMVHTLPGTTFSNVKARGDYPSEAKACYTLEDFRGWLVERICHTYHVSRHRTLGEPPLIAWERSFRNEDGTFRTPPLPAGADTLRSDFYPFEYRRMQRTGVQFRCSRYWNDALAPFVHPERQLAVHYHPNDASRVWVRTEEGALIEALPVAGRAVVEQRQVTLSAQDMERLDALKAEGYAESDAIKERAQSRARQRPSSNPQSRKAGGAGARPSSTRERPKPPLNRASIRVEVLDV